MGFMSLRRVLPGFSVFAGIVALAACSSSSSIGSNGDRLGTLYDSPVQGMDYLIAGQLQRQTDFLGRFVYRPGQRIRFQLAGIPVGDEVLTAPTLSIRNLFSGATLADRRVINLARLLQTLDRDGQTANGLDLVAAVNELLALPSGQKVDSLQLDVDPADFAAQNPKLMAYLSQASKTLVAPAAAREHLSCSEQDADAGRQPDGQCAQPAILGNDVRVAEGDARHEVVVTLTLSAASSETVTVSYATEADTATADSDFEMASGSVSFAPGETSQSIRIVVLGDTVVEPDERFRVRLSGAQRATLAQDSINVTLTDDDTSAGVTRLVLAPAHFAEGTGAQANVVSYRVSREGNLAGAVSFRASTVAGTATAGSDYVALDQQVFTVAAGADHVDIPLQLVADAEVETAETFQLVVSADAGVVISGSPATITIDNDDQPAHLPGLHLAGPVTVDEGQDGSTEARVRAVLSAASAMPVKLTYATLAGSARGSGERRDYDAVEARQIVIPAGETEVDLPVTIRGDRYQEFDETLTLAVTALDGARPEGAQQALVTLRNDDALTLLQVGSAKAPAEPTDAEVAGQSESYLGGTRTQFFHLGGYGFGPFKLLPAYGPFPGLNAGGDPLPVSNPPAGARCFSRELDVAGKQPTQCADTLWVRAMILRDPKTSENLAFVTVDAIGAGNLVQDAVKKAVNQASCALGAELCIPTRNVLFGQTHSHAGADLQGLWGGVPREWQQQRLVAGAAAAVTQALQARRPARLSLARGDADDFNGYRRPMYRKDEHHRSDPTVSLFMAKADDADSSDPRLVGELLQFAAHPTSIGNDDYRRPDGSVVRVPHPDYPLGVTQRLEERFGAAAIYYNGPIADASPSGPNEGSTVYDRVKSRGRHLADKALSFLDNAVPIDPVLTVRHQEVVLPVTNPLFLGVGLLGQFNGYYQFGQLPRDEIPGFDQLPTDLVDQFEAYQNQLPQPATVARTLVSRISLGTADAASAERNRLEIVTIPGEATNTFGQYIRKLAGDSPLTQARPKTHTMLLGLTHNSFGYILPEDEFSYVDPSGNAGFVLPGTGYEEFVSLGPLTAPLLRGQGYNPLFDVAPSDPRNLPPLITDCQVALDFGACFVGVMQDRVMQFLGLPSGLFDSFKGGLRSLAEGCHDVAGPLEPGCALFDAVADAAGALPSPGGGDPGVPEVPGVPGGSDAVELALFPEVLKAQAQGCDILDPAACLLPFPSNHFTRADATTDTGLRIDINPLAPPRNTAGKPVDVSEFNRNDGFSPGQAILLRVPGLDLARTASGGTLVPRIGNMRNSLDLANSAVVVYDVEADQPHMVWAELDANVTGYSPCDATAPLQTLAELGGQDSMAQGVQAQRDGCNGAIKPGTDARAANDPTSDPGPLLIIRPGINFEEGHRYIVAVRRLRDGEGKTIHAGAAFGLCRGDVASPLKQLPLVQQRCAGVASVLETLRDKAGIAKDDLYLAWDFTVASRRNLSERLLGIRDHAFNVVLNRAAPAYQITSVEEPAYNGGATDCREAVAPHGRGDTSNCLARIIKGTIDVPNYISTPQASATTQGLDRQLLGRFNYEPSGSDPLYGDGIPDQSRTQPTVKVPFTCQIPRSVMSQPVRRLGSDNEYTVRPARVSLYGHGLFGSQGEIGQGQLRRFGNEHNVAFCATDWVGMSGAGDVANAVLILNDMSLFPTLTDRVQQGVLNFQFLARLLHDSNGFAKDPVFQAPDGRPLIDNREVFYDGNSQGGIIGGVLVATSPDVHRGVLGVPGMNYSTLLQRSVDFSGYARLMYPSYPNTVDQQLVFAMIQMLWDRGENDGYAQHLGDGVAGTVSVGGRDIRIGQANTPLPGLDGKPMPEKQVLLHPGFGDHQVAMVSAEVMARTVGANGYDFYYQRDNRRGGDVTHTYAAGLSLDAVLADRYPDPAGSGALPYFGLTRMAYGDAAAIRGSALMVLDEGKTAVPPADNRPPSADDFDPHEYPRNTVMARCQKARFLRADGRVIYSDQLTDPTRCPQQDGLGQAFTGDAAELPPGQAPAPAERESDRGSGVLGALAQFGAALNQAFMAFLDGDYAGALSLGQIAFSGLGADMVALFDGPDSLPAAGSAALGEVPDPQSMFGRFMVGVGRFLGLQSDPVSAVTAMRAQRSVEAVILTGSQLPGWSAPEAQGVGYPYPSGANITGQGSGSEALAPLNAVRDPLKVGEVRDAHNGQMIYPAVGQVLPLGTPVDEIAAYRWTGSAFEEIPVQVDEKYPFFLANAGSTFSVYSGTDPELTYAWDRENWDARDAADPCRASYPAGKPDPVASLDNDDEIVFMARDAGAMAPAGSTPPKATQTQMVRLQDAADPQAERVVYLVRQAGGSAFRGQRHYVRYNRKADADQWIDRGFFASGDPEALGTSNTSYGPNRKGTVCQPGQAPRQSVDRFPRDGLVVETDTYRWEASGRWMVRDIRIKAPGTATPDWATQKDTRPDLLDRWKGRAFQQSPDSTISLVGFEDEQVNWEANSTLLGERCGPVRCMREVWGADSGTNVTKTETFYRDAVSYRYRIRVHPIPPDGLYTSWDYNRSAMLPDAAERAAGVQPGRYYTALRPQGVPIDGINDDLGQVDAVAPIQGYCVTSDGPKPVDPAVGKCPLFLDAADPTFNLPLAFSNWEQVSGKGSSGSLVYTFQLMGATSLANPLVVPYYRDDACLDDGTGDDPVARPWPGEASTDARVVAGYRDLDGNGKVDCHERQGVHGANGIHYFATHDSDNAFTPTTSTEVDGQQWQFMVPTEQPRNVGDAYANVIRTPLLALVVPLTPPSAPLPQGARQEAAVAGRRRGLAGLADLF